MFPVSGRKGIVSIGVFIANLSIPTMNNDLAVDRARNLFRTADRATLRIVSRTDLICTLSSNSPAAVRMSYYVGITLFAHSLGLPL